MTTFNNPLLEVIFGMERGFVPVASHAICANLP